MAASFASIGVVGAGAVGSYYGAMLARAGHRVTLIARAPHVAAIERHGLQLHKGGTVEAVTLGATTEPDAVREADLVLFCVKSTDTEAVGRQIAPHLRRDALLMSLQNGVDNAPTLAGIVPCTVVPTVVYVATAMPEPGVVTHHGRGDLVVGPLNASQANDATLYAICLARPRSVAAGSVSPATSASSALVSENRIPARPTATATASPPAPADWIRSARA